MTNSNSTKRVIAFKEFQLEVCVILYNFSLLNLVASLTAVILIFKYGSYAIKINNSSKMSWIIHLREREKMELIFA